MRTLLSMLCTMLAAMAISAPVAAQRNNDTVECRSQDFGRNRCDTDWRDARILRQLSSSACVEGRSWGFNRGAIWVDKGCQAVFARAGGHGGRPDDGDNGGGHAGGWRPGNDWDQDIRFRCESRDFHYNLCQVDVGRGGRVYIDQQISETRCVEGRSWGSNRAGVWVDQGCAAVFVVERRWR
ncbi:MAG: DUF3011 domain-containing protein [Tahibacter sp.]